jgi:hypothetical protein
VRVKAVPRRIGSVGKGHCPNLISLYKSQLCLGFMLFELLFPSMSVCDTTISVDARPNPSQIFVNEGTITVNYSITLTVVGTGSDGGGPTDTGDSLRISVSAGGTDLIVIPVESFTVAQGTSTVSYGTFSFDNPVSQFLEISGSGGYVREITRPIQSIYPLFQQWTVLNGQTTIVGGDTPPISPKIPPPESSQSSGRAVRSNIHAVIVSGLSDPAKVIASTNVTLTGGIVALGRTASSLPSSWSSGLQIVPDYALLTGEKIPPVTPNILDVRIVRQEVTADFPSPNPQPSN